MNVKEFMQVNHGDSLLMGTSDCGRYMADKQPHELDKEHIPALQNFAKAITKRLETMVKASGVLMVRRPSSR